jgi:hypothetical protein
MWGQVTNAIVKKSTGQRGQLTLDFKAAAKKAAKKRSTARKAKKPDRKSIDTKKISNRAVDRKSLSRKSTKKSMTSRKITSNRKSVDMSNIPTLDTVKKSISKSLTKRQDKPEILSPTAVKNVAPIETNIKDESVRTKDENPVEPQVKATPMNKVDALKMMLGEVLFHPKPIANSLNPSQTKKMALAAPMSALDKLKMLLQETVLNHQSDKTTTTTTEKPEVLALEDPTSNLSFVERMTNFMAKKMYGKAAKNNDETATTTESTTTTTITATEVITQLHRDPMSELDNALEKLKNLLHSKLSIDKSEIDVVDSKNDEITKDPETENRTNESQPDQV